MAENETAPEPGQNIDNAFGKGMAAAIRMSLPAMLSPAGGQTVALPLQVLRGLQAIEVVCE